ncbi:MAG: M20/M25/M40 family metallo-hydrolase, partial [Acetobacteraceae bacterium]|nr:M20/M25/M40 family metallo-hydrolase [Acetobacteraceae bacterium]
LQTVLASLGGLQITWDPRRKIRPRVNLGFVHGGYEDRTGLFLDRCCLGLSVRGPVGVTPATVQADLDRFVGALRLDPDVKVRAQSLHPAYSWMPPFEAQGAEAVIAALAEAHRAATGSRPHIGLGPLDYAGTDAGVWQYLGGVPCAVYGPGGSSGTFSAPEKVRTEDIVTAARVYAGAAARLLAPAGDGGPPDGGRRGQPQQRG